jgi:hypothetical protein
MRYLIVTLSLPIDLVSASNMDSFRQLRRSEAADLIFHESFQTNYEFTVKANITGVLLGTDWVP